MRTKPAVLITGGRAPVALDLARLFKRAGYRVLAAESMKYSLLSFSQAVDRWFSLPGPNRDEAGFVEGLVSLIRQHGVDWLIPTCEETFFIAKHRKRLEQGCRVLTDRLETLEQLHHKGSFIEELKRAGEHVPKTVVLHHRSEWKRGVEEVPFPAVLKPAYSRFATRVLFLEEPPEEPPVSLEQPWVLQERIAGPQLSAYAVAYHGRLAAYSCYRTVYTAGLGSALTFRHEEEPQVYEWVDRLVKRYGYTGQIAFDFIQSRDDGRFYPLECNPRATSGIHLFTEPSLVEAMVGGDCSSVVIPAADTKTMLVLPMVLYGWRQGKPWNWIRTMAAHRDVVFDWRDPAPFWGQGLSLWHLWRTARKQHLPLLKLTTQDIEWEGENDGTGNRGYRFSRTSLGEAPASVGAKGNGFRAQ
ncbi:ATP-grasp domain-containing protein [Desmospora profundinema]|uniref:ATP-grasp domain-containing protein n=1 Tax=Desmospora profundinema TaxID=1571184 RepID=A0ABU1IPY0_9BACL|nr:ATP-grasp domain-containing protein [Desmospora profundinema]MDR6226179.1 hypothetical protein [Desmospora profundinema]